MFFKKTFGRDRTERTAARSLYLAAVEKARDPLFYLNLGVADTVDGRFDMIVIHVMLVMRRLRPAGESGRVVAQELFDLMFRDMDRSLRELGVGDLSVGRHIKKMAKAFYGRATAYEEGLDAVTGDDGTSLFATLGETVYAKSDGSVPVKAMIDYLRRADEFVGAQVPEDLAKGRVDFAVPVLTEMPRDNP